jgi:hypothetical protein
MAAVAGTAKRIRGGAAAFPREERGAFGRFEKAAKSFKKLVDLVEPPDV